MPDSSKWRLYRNYLFLLPLFAVILFYQAAYVASSARILLHPEAVPSRPFGTSGPVVTGVDPRAAAAGLRTGDVIRTIDEVPFTNDRVLFEAAARTPLGSVLRVGVQRQGRGPLIQVSVPARFREPPGTAIEWALYAVLNLFLLGCVLVGIYVAAVLPHDPRALIVFGLMVSISNVVTLVSWYQFPHALWVVANTVRILETFTWALWLILFALYFPHRFSWDVRRPWLKWLIVGPILLWTAAVSLESVLAYASFRASSLFRSPDPRLLLAVGMTLFFTGLHFKMRAAKSLDAARRLRVLVTGTTVAVVPVALLIGYEALTHHDQFNQLPLAIVLTVCFIFFLFPVTLAYVVVADRAMNLRMVVRQGIRYALAKGAVRLTSGIVSGAFIWSAANLLFGSGMSIEVKVALFAAVAVLTSFIFQRTRVRAQKWVDAKFFREAYNAEKVLEDLSDNVLSIVEEHALLDTVARRISETLHVRQIAVLLEHSESLRAVYSLGLDEAMASTCVLPSNGSAVAAVTRSNEPALVYFDRRDNWVHEAPESESLALRSLGSQLLLPVGPKNRMLGVLSLGPKQSEEPYSKSDINLLRSLTVQTGLAIENGRLTVAVATEMAQRERLNREVEIAREVQERLFPQSLPCLPGIDYFGACRPALGVGGDYYDFLPLTNGELGIAIGDVSGKGIAAALLMASLQASLRSQALVSEGDLARLMRNVNQLVYNATPINRYATFFYGKYNRLTQVFTYVNAGHNPPVILRRTIGGTAHIIRLDTGGPVIGLLPEAPYQQASLVLQAGDIFLGFTDGISEAMNIAEEEWGEERLIPAIGACADLSAAEMIPSLMQEADRFVSGAPQHDDMTLIVMKLAAGRA